MHTATKLYAALFLAFYTSASPISHDKRQGNNYPQGASDVVVLDIPAATAVPPPSATGDPYGTSELLGYDGNPVHGSARVQDYRLVPGQLEDPDEGLELDFKSVDKPQPIRGTKDKSGGTDPGPGECLM